MVVRCPNRRAHQQQIFTSTDARHRPGGVSMGTSTSMCVVKHTMRLTHTLCQVIRSEKISRAHSHSHRFSRTQNPTARRGTRDVNALHARRSNSRCD